MDEITKVVLDYIEGWYEGSTERMNNALSEDLVKRLVKNDTCETLNKEKMMLFTQYGGGKNYTGEKKSEIKILDVSGNIATVACFSAEYVDYLHLGKMNGKWKIINVLWCLKEDIAK